MQSGGLGSRPNMYDYLVGEPNTVVNLEPSLAKASSPPSGMVSLRGVEALISENHRGNLAVNAETTGGSLSTTASTSARAKPLPVQATPSIKKNIAQRIMKATKDGIRDLCEKRGRDITIALAAVVKLAQIMVTGTPIAEQAVNAIAAGVKALQVSLRLCIFHVASD